MMSQLKIKNRMVTKYFVECEIQRRCQFRRLYSVRDRWMNVYGASAERYWQGKTELFREESVPVPICPPQISHRMICDRTRAFVVRGRRLTFYDTEPRIQEEEEHGRAMLAAAVPPPLQPHQNTEMLQRVIQILQATNRIAKGRQ